MPSRHRWFAYDGDSFDIFETPEEARAYAQAGIDLYAEYAGDGWPSCGCGEAGMKPRPLSMRETIACVDEAGRIRCPSCGRYARLDEMSRDNTASMTGTVMSLLPRCARCQGRPA